MKKIILFILAATFFIIFMSLFIFTLSNFALAQPSEVKIEKKLSKRWQLMVNGQPFYIKGVGIGEDLTSKNIDRYFKLAQELGANTIRRWGSSEYDRLILQKALKYNLMVALGIWLLNTGEINYVTDDIAKRSQIKNVLRYVNKHKGHPAVLMWLLGNEVILNATQENRKIAFAKHLEEITQAIHKEDPNHPVVYVDAGDKALPYIKRYAPSLDIYGVNYFAGVPNFFGEWKSSGVDIPYIFAEFGPPGPWEVSKDSVQEPKEHTEQEKADYYLNWWRSFILRNEGYNLGGFAFILSQPSSNEGSPTWRGLTYNGLKRASFYALKEAYTGKSPRNGPPVISWFDLNKRRGISPYELIDLRVVAKDNEELKLNYEYKIYDVDNKDFIDERIEFQDFGYKLSFKAPKYPGVYRVYLSVTDGKGNIAIANKVISVSSD